MKPIKVKITSIALSLLFVAACSKPRNETPPAHKVPTSWYNSDAATTDKSRPSTNETHKTVDTSKGESPVLPSEDDFESNKALNQSIENIFTANALALEEGDLKAQSMMFQLSPLKAPLPTTKPNNDKPKDWVPWRAEYFMTDLSLTGSGLIGMLAFKGTSTVRAFWRRQGPAPGSTDFNKTASDKHSENTSTPPEAVDDASANAEPTIMVTDSSTPQELVKQLEPAINAAVATGKIKDTPVLRKNLLEAAKDFQMIATSIPNTDEDLPWWVSRFRLDFMIDAAGRVEPVGMVGGEVRFRFEWHRIQRVTSTAASFSAQKTIVPLDLSEKQSKLRESLKDFVLTTAQDINAAFAEHTVFGFKAHQVRMGIGISVKGNIGLIKGSAGVVGQIYFTRHTERPKLYPIPEKEKIYAHTLSQAHPSTPLLIIEKKPTPEHLRFATQNKMLLETSEPDDEGGFGEAIYRLERDRFLKGLQKAAMISAYFAKRATQSQFKNWKVYELRSAFDASISGGFDLVTIVGSATAQVSMFNTNF